MKRYKKFTYILRLFLTICIFSLVYLSFFNHGIFFDGVVNSQGNLDMEIKNTSSHLKNNLEIILNGESVDFLESLKPDEIYINSFPVSDGFNTIKISAKNTFPYESSFRVDFKGNNPVSQNNDYKFSLSYGSFFQGLSTDVMVKICNLGNLSTLKVELDNSSDYFSNDYLQEIVLDENECYDVLFNINPINSGQIKVKFKIYNDVYSRDIERFVDVI